MEEGAAQGGESKAIRTVERDSATLRRPLYGNTLRQSIRTYHTSIQQIEVVAADEEEEE